MRCGGNRTLWISKGEGVGGDGIGIGIGISDWIVMAVPWHTK